MYLSPSRILRPSKASRLALNRPKYVVLKISCILPYWVLKHFSTQNNKKTSHNTNTANFPFCIYKLTKNKIIYLSVKQTGYWILMYGDANQKWEKKTNENGKGKKKLSSWIPNWMTNLYFGLYYALWVFLCDIMSLKVTSAPKR